MTITVDISKMKSQEVGVTERRTRQVIGALARLEASGKLKRSGVALKGLRQLDNDNGTEVRVLAAFLNWCMGD